jgi:hypothetical protein
MAQIQTGSVTNGVWWSIVIDIPTLRSSAWSLSVLTENFCGFLLEIAGVVI